MYSVSTYVRVYIRVRGKKRSPYVSPPLSVVSAYRIRLGLRSQFHEDLKIGVLAQPKAQAESGVGPFPYRRDI